MMADGIGSHIRSVILRRIFMVMHDACENVIPGPGLTDAVLQLSALVYVRETQKVFPFSTSSFTISIIT